MIVPVERIRWSYDFGGKDTRIAASSEQANPVFTAALFCLSLRRGSDLSGVIVRRKHVVISFVCHRDLCHLPPSTAMKAHSDI